VGRLFWKFFLVFFLAQLTTVFGVGGTLWLRDLTSDEPRWFGSRQIVDQQLNAAALSYEYGGVPALNAFMRQLELPEGYRIFAVDSQGRDILGRPVDVQHLKAAHAATRQLPQAPGVRTLARGGEESYLLFAVGREGEVGRFIRRHPRGVPMLPVVIGLLASLLFGALLARYFSKPIRNLQQALQAAGQGDLQSRPGANMGMRRDELADLAREFDRMAAQLHAVMSSQRRLLHDVSHELRSPLARQQAAIDVARQQPDKLPEAMQRLELELNRMDVLVGELLALSRLEAGVQPDLSDDIDVSELLDEIAADARFEAEALGKTFQVSIGAPAHVQGNFELLRRAIENVVRNAIKHTPPAAGVSIVASATAQRLRIEVMDEGEGVAPDELDTIFEAFYRGRNSSAYRGYGLGLAIARRVIEAHGGRLSARNRDSGGLCVSIELPLAATSGRPDQA
jgi:two-component system OmpR family sensor kinase